MKTLIAILTISALLSATRAEVGLPQIFSNGMILQREMPVPIWGTADPGEKIVVSFAGQIVSDQANTNGNWLIKLAPLEASNEARTLSIKATNQIVLKNILVGEVWLCSGQSNMAGTFVAQKGRRIHPDDFKTDYSRFRFNGHNKGWDTISEKTQNRLSMVAYYFGKDIYRNLNVPVGLITRYNSGTPIQAWMPRKAAEEIRETLKIPKNWRDPQDKPPRFPGAQFDEKIAPIIPYALRGAIWYQGERNAKSETAFEYDKLLAFHIKTWRDLWGKRADLKPRLFPFYYIQIPTQVSPVTAEWPWLRDRMRRALDITENTGMAICYDEGPSLHPENKEPFGKRLALHALANDYGNKSLVPSGPLLDEVKIKGDEAILSFHHIGGGLVSKSGDEELNYFEISGKDGEYVPAEARIDGDTVTVRSEPIPNPVYVRYLFRKSEPSPEVSLLNKEGLPASSFITDDFPPKRTGGFKPTELPWIERAKNPIPPQALQSKFDSPPDLGLAPEVTDLNAKDISYSLEQKIPYLKKPFINASPKDRKDGLKVGTLGVDGGNKELILKFAQEIAKESPDPKTSKTDSLLISYKGKLVFESYYRRGRQNYPHYQMSITKSYTALAMGRAIQLGHLKMEDLDTPAIHFLTDIDPSKMVKGASQITLDHAMTMRSGIRLPEKKIRQLVKNQNQLKGQGQIQAYLQHSRPIPAPPREFKYQASDPSLTMQVLDAVVPGTAEDFIEAKFLGELGIQNYAWQPDTSGLPKSAAGSSLCSRDMVKIGQLVLNNGQWNGQQFLPADFIKRATDPLAYSNGENNYGYFWWSNEPRVNGKKYLCKAGRGAGGQYILIFPQLDLITVITAHNKGMGTMLKDAPQKIITAFTTPSSR